MIGGSLLAEHMNSGFSNRTRVPGRATLPSGPQQRVKTSQPYSAASANNVFGFAAEIMKSWTRGTIYDLKRLPLNTP
jgi:hypothetical protein